MSITTQEFYILTCIKPDHKTDDFSEHPALSIQFEILKAKFPKIGPSFVGEMRLVTGIGEGKERLSYNYVEHVIIWMHSHNQLVMVHLLYFISYQLFYATPHASLAIASHALYFLNAHKNASMNQHASSQLAIGMVCYKNVTLP